MTYNKVYEKDVIMVTDLETTGLSPKTDLPLEIGISIMINDIDEEKPTLEEIDSIQLVLITPETIAWAENTLNTPEDERNIAQQMHIDNSLITEILNPEIASKNIIFIQNINTADEFLKEWIINNELSNYPLVGASVGSLDRPFIQEFFPQFNSVLSYRNVDTSAIAETIKLFDADWGKELRESAYANIGATKTAHRTLEDARHCAQALSWQLKHLQLF